VLESSLLERSASTPESPASFALEYLRVWRASGARRVLVDVAAPWRATEGLHAGFEREVRGRVILAARLGIRSFSSSGNEKNGENSGFVADGRPADADGWPRSLLPDPPDGDYVFSRRCDWSRAVGDAVVELSEYPGNASVVILVPRGQPISARAHFDHLRLTDWWDHPLDAAGSDSIRTAADALCAAASGLDSRDLAMVASVLSSGKSDIGVMSLDSLSSYLASVRGIDGADEDCEEEEGVADAGPYEAAGESILLSLFGSTDPTELGFALDGGMDVGDFDEFVSAIRRDSARAEHLEPWSRGSLESLFRATVPAAQMAWRDGVLHTARGSTNALPLFFLAFADRFGNAAIAMLHFQLADGWREWIVRTDPLIDLGDPESA